MKPFATEIEVLNEPYLRISLTEEGFVRIERIDPGAPFDHVDVIPETIDILIEALEDAKSAWSSYRKTL